LSIEFDHGAPPNLQQVAKEAQQSDYLKTLAQQPRPQS